MLTLAQAPRQAQAIATSDVLSQISMFSYRDGRKSDLTAEPHFAVTAPSSMIALYNVADDVKGTESKVTTLTERSDYSGLRPLSLDETNSTEIIQARYALAIAGQLRDQRVGTRGRFEVLGNRGALSGSALSGRGAYRQHG